MKSDEERDRLHDAIVARFPNGLTPQLYRQVILESANDEEDGLVYPHAVAVPGQPFYHLSFMLSMSIDGLLTHWDDQSGKPFMHQPIRYRITEKGRLALEGMLAESALTPRQHNPPGEIPG